MFVPGSSSSALAVALFSMCCWGSWSNSLKFTDGLMRFEIFYLNWAIACFVCSLIFGFALGMFSGNGARGSSNFLDDFTGKAPDRYFFAAAAGFVFNIANLCLCKGITMLGLTLAFPICIGTALVLGTLVTYAVQPSGNFVFLLLGVAVAFAAVCLAAYVQKIKDEQMSARGVSKELESGITGGFSVRGQELMPTAPEVSSDPSMTRKVLVCVVGGVLMGLWNPLVALAEKSPGLSAYGELSVYTGMMFCSSLVLLPALLRCPIDGSTPMGVWLVLSEYTSVPKKAHLWSFVGGAIWTAGTLSNAVAGDSGVLSSAESYAIGQCANMVAIFWGAFFFNEFQGTNYAVKGLLVVVCSLYVVAIVMITLSSSS
eukprot:gnl/MRDRNA2_/MRDRNA2_79988_c0_seq1.p1 gnl/MRDRNA2_/MRDRNA2_79988_c0~~gnl/MRDRNA2_/MRDRNA2_79988_c0_seq1.p1  ORF type:complete len:402 (-),score=45.67 gnl/MRDRNA2_/MRDRNA2_79988_c0_seq1:266-1378(-)